ncbi:MAG: GTP 3',8-cyclase MoaA [Burkholderiales bacterium]|jgi:cyclic pyranopterin phosphate synthase|nr:GTP 3',8-cyclase MoaA [Burkholderiales bacterium]
MTKTIPLLDAAEFAQQQFQQTVRNMRLAQPEALPSPLLDPRQRPLHDLRISVTDRCNFRCTYCMPKNAFGRDHIFLEHDEVLRFEEIARLAQLFTHLGVRKIRLTGGEPLLRKNIERLIEMLSAIDGIDLTLTTNASILAKKAQSLRNAGLQRITVSLDAIDDTTFRQINDVNFPLTRVLEGIDAANRAGFMPIKINTVVKRGVNENAILPLIRHFKGSGHIVRFIEFMDVGATNGWRMDDVVSAVEIVDTINAEFPLEPIDPNYQGEVAGRWRFKDGNGEIGVIASVTQAFCRDCTRMRLSTNGQLFTCLFADRGYDFRALLRDGADDNTLIRAIATLWQNRDDNYSEQRTANTPRTKKIEMSYIGG